MGWQIVSYLAVTARSFCLLTNLSYYTYLYKYMLHAECSKNPPPFLPSVKSLDSLVFKSFLP
jgi:hypothetical protein